jgi:hypothetical protein
MRVLTRREKIEFFVVAPVLFCLWLALFLYSIQEEPVDVGYLIACSMIALGSGFSITRNGSSFMNVLISVCGLQVTQFAFFRFEEMISNFSTLTLQYISIYLMSLTSVTTITWLIKGKPVKTKLSNPI